MIKDEFLKAIYLAGFSASAEGYNAEYPFGEFYGKNPEQDEGWVRGRDRSIEKLKPEWAELTRGEIKSWELPDAPTFTELVWFIERKIREKNE
jgi:hypothetical protein